MHSDETVMLSVLSEMIFQKLFPIVLVHFGIEVTYRVCQGAAEPFDLLKCQIGIEIDDT